MNSQIFIILSIYAFLVPTEATSGVDTSGPLSLDTWNCLVENGNSFAIVQAYQNTGEVNANAVDSVKNAHQGGIMYVDGFLTPCYSCGNPDGQLSDTVRNLNMNDADVGQIWLDIGDIDQWDLSPESNVAFIQGLVDEADRLGVIVGIFSNADDWNAITNGSPDFSYLQLWYSSNDGIPSFAGFVSFGGWTKPAIKQYELNSNECEVNFNKDFY